MQLDANTLINLIASGGLAATLASLLRVQYETRIKETAAAYEKLVGKLEEQYKERLAASEARTVAQSAKIDALLKANDELADSFAILSKSSTTVAAAIEAISNAQRATVAPSLESAT